MHKIPVPGVMSIDREKWKKELHLSNFINTAYVFNDILTYACNVHSILLIGPGQGLDKVVLNWRGYKITTFDIDKVFEPDYLGSVHDLSVFHDKQFDAVVVSHVLEHIAADYLDKALSEIARVATYALIYLPVAGRHFQLRLKLDIKAIDISGILDAFNWFHKPEGRIAHYASGQHFWEVGMRGFTKRDISKLISKQFEIINTYRNKDWNPSINFVLKAKA